ncbi:hypothetical protein [Bradyrhizobium sp. CCGB01]|uniref:hypothetical protein n=1 Tax=Bradyrhizobium sp. CCGB01 TaxID=2949634 RepID=UPI0020B3AE13|nr:hypothetical protein [Bradyrhizobium sp. CCGB01]MCP3410383.1 hypothetical protein [Bradyrhizobium sp. CCGB01]
MFNDDEKLSRTFATKEKALEKADEAGLVEQSKGSRSWKMTWRSSHARLIPSLKTMPISTGRPIRQNPDPASASLADALDLSIDVGVPRGL